MVLENIFHRVERLVTCHTDPYSAAVSAHAVVICTEWDEFSSLDYKRIYGGMAKPAFLFDGRKILDHDAMIKIGFHVETIGKRLHRKNVERVWTCSISHGIGRRTAGL